MFNQAGYVWAGFPREAVQNKVNVEGFFLGQITNYLYSRKLLNNSSKAIAIHEVQNHRKKQYLYSK